MKNTSQELLKLCLEAAIEAGAEILKVYNQEFAVEHKSDNSPLTLADKNAHHAIVKFLETTDYPILSEEGKHLPYEERKKWKRFWLVDPLDGTKEFVKKNGEFTVNIALVENGLPILGVIFTPVMGKMFWATKGEGAYYAEAVSSVEYCFRNAEKMGEHQAIKVFRVVGSRSHMTEETQKFIEKELCGKPFEMVSIGSSLKFCLVAENKAQLYPRLAPTMEWDTAAGHIIVAETGKKVYQYENGKPLVYNKENLLNPWFVVA